MLTQSTERDRCDTDGESWIIAANGTRTLAKGKRGANKERSSCQRLATAGGVMVEPGVTASEVTEYRRERPQQSLLDEAKDESSSHMRRGDAPGLVGGCRIKRQT